MCTGTHPYIPATNVAKGEVIYDQDGQEVVNVFHFLSDVGWDATRLGQLCEMLSEWVTASILPDYPLEYSLREIKCTDLTTQTGAVAQTFFSPPGFGEQTTSNPLPNNCSVVIKWITGKRGRSYRGRTYYPCITDAMAAGNKLTVGGLATVGNAAGELFTAALDHQWWLVVVSYCHDKAWRTVADITRITSYAVDETLDSQRRRLPGRGR